MSNPNQGAASPSSGRLAAELNRLLGAVEPCELAKRHNPSDLAEDTTSEQQEYLRWQYASSIADFKTKSALPSRRSKLCPSFHHFILGEEPSDLRIADVVRQKVRSAGLATESLKVRRVTSDLLLRVVGTGSDRDRSSSINHEVERHLLTAFGIASAAAVTYVSDLDRWSDHDEIGDQANDAILVYDAAKLHKVGNEPNGFYAFIGTPADALIAILA